MLYFIMFIIVAAGWYYADKENRQNKREKKRQDALWRMASIKEHIENSQFSR